MCSVESIYPSDSLLPEMRNPPATDQDCFFEIQPGLSVCISHSHSEGVTASFPGDQEYIHLNCLLKGCFEARVKDVPMHYTAGEITMGYSDGEMFYLNNSPSFSNLAVMITPELLCDMAGEELSEINPEKGVHFFVRNAGKNQKASYSAKQIASLMNSKSQHKLLLHSAVLDFIYWHLSAFKNQHSQVSSISSRERRQLDMARDYLLKDLSQAPTIADVATTVGLNQCKLKKGFKTLFGNSIYAYYQKARMEEAMTLLKNHNVTETAMLLGYSNVSHFSTAFRKQFNILPGDARKEIAPDFSGIAIF